MKSVKRVVATAGAGTLLAFGSLALAAPAEAQAGASPTADARTYGVLDFLVGEPIRVVGYLGCIVLNRPGECQ
ncbi:hypothetical protein ACWD4B_12400 [Streptomyces sp. NPDC002536]